MPGKVYMGDTGHLPANVADPAALTSIDLDDGTGATADAEGDLGNLADGSTYANDHGAIEINFATIAAQYNALRADVAALRTVVVNILSMFDEIDLTS